MPSSPLTVAKEAARALCNLSPNDNGVVQRHDACTTEGGKEMKRLRGLPDTEGFMHEKISF